MHDPNPLAQIVSALSASQSLLIDAMVLLYLATFVIVVVGVVVMLGLDVLLTWWYPPTN